MKVKRVLIVYIALIIVFILGNNSIVRAEDIDLSFQYRISKSEWDNLEVGSSIKKGEFEFIKLPKGEGLVKRIDKLDSITNSGNLVMDLPEDESFRLDFNIENNGEVYISAGKITVESSEDNGKAIIKNNHIFKIEAGEIVFENNNNPAGIIDNIDGKLEIRADKKLIFKNNQGSLENIIHNDKDGILSIDAGEEVLFFKNELDRSSLIYNEGDLYFGGSRLIFFDNTSGDDESVTLYNRGDINVSNQILYLKNVGPIKLESDESKFKIGGEDLLELGNYNRRSYKNTKILLNQGPVVIWEEGELANMKLGRLIYRASPGYFYDLETIKESMDFNKVLDEKEEIVLEDMDRLAREGYAFKAWSGPIDEEEVRELILRLNKLNLYDGDFESLCRDLDYIAKSEELNKLLELDELKFTADWEDLRDLYIFKFIDRTGMNVDQTFDLYEGDSFKFPKVERPIFEKDGLEYKFIGWTDGFKSFETGEEAEVMESKVFTALWEKSIIEDENYIPSLPIDRPNEKDQELAKDEESFNGDYTRPSGRLDPELAASLVKYEINRLKHYWYIKGYPEGDIRPNENITREEFVSIITRTINRDFLEVIDRSKMENSFIDVEEGRWSEKYINILASLGIIEGYSDNTFKPKEFISTGEIAKIIFYLNDLKPVEKSKFKDLEGHWAATYIDALANEGWVRGYEDRTYRPEEYTSRAEVVELINNMLFRNARLENMIDGRLEFTDLNEEHRFQWYYEGFQEATNSHKYKIDGEDEIWISILEREAHW